MKNWFYNRSPGARAGLTMGGGCLAVIFVIALVVAIIGWFGWALLWLIPLAVAFWIVGWVCKGIYSVWAFLTSEFEKGDKQK